LLIAAFLAGDYVINSAVEPLPAYTFGVRQINVHPYFKFTPQADRFDVAVLTLERPVHYMPHIGEERKLRVKSRQLMRKLFSCTFSADLLAREE
jgi:hypothetical protein